MKSFHRTKLIPSLVASTMVATAILMPLPSLLTSGTAYAHNSTTPHINIDRLARLNLFTPGHNGIDVQITYQCSFALSITATPNIDVTVQQSASQSGSGVPASGEDTTTPIKCDGYEHTVAVTVAPFATIPNGSFNVNNATVTATLTDYSGISISDTQDVKVEV
jgi:hypothetical protein